MIKLELTPEEVNLVGAALAKLPYEMVAALLGKLRDQAVPQMPQDPQEPAAQA